MADIIKHRGRIESINGSHIRVRIVQTSACSACSIKGHCNASESKEKIVDVHDFAAANYRVGEEVNVYGTTTMGMQAIFLAFGVPFLILLVVLLVALKLTANNELLSALVSLFFLLPYYLILYVCRGRLSRHFSFSIETINN